MNGLNGILGKKRPVKALPRFWLTVRNVLGLLLHVLVAPLVLLHGCFARAQRRGSVSYCVNRIDELNRLLGKIEATLLHECSRVDADREVIKRLVKMQTAALEERADVQQDLHTARAALARDVEQ